MKAGNQILFYLSRNALTPLIGCLLVLLSLISLQAFATELTLELDRTTVAVGDTFNVRVKLTKPFARSSIPKAQSTIDPALEVVSGPSIASQTQIFNGKVSAETTWEWRMQATKAGKFTIPAFELDGAKTASAELQVSAQSTSANTKDNQDIMVTMEVSDKEALLNEQITLTWKIMYRTQTRGEVKPVELPSEFVGELIEPHAGKRYTANIGGESYQVREYRMAIFGQQEGTFELPGVKYVGEYRPLTQRYGRYQDITVSAEPIEVTVVPKPTGFTQQAGPNTPFVPSTKLTLSAQWAIPDQPLGLGEPISLEVNTVALGQITGQLPKVLLEGTTDYKVYKDDQSAQNISDWNNGFTARRTQKFALIPQHPGSFKLPTLQMEWWNISANRLEVTNIEGETVEVAGAKNASALGLPTTSSSIDDATQDTDDTETAEDSLLIEDAFAEDPESEGLWRWLAFALFLLWLGTMLFAWNSFRGYFKRKRIQQRNIDQETDVAPLPKTNFEPRLAPKPKPESTDPTLQSRRKVQLSLVPLLDTQHHNDEISRAECKKLLQILQQWLSHETGKTVQSIASMQAVIAPNDPWQAQLQCCQDYLYGTADNWPRETIKALCIKSLPMLRSDQDPMAPSSSHLKPIVPK